MEQQSTQGVEAEMQAAEEPGARAVVARRPTFWRRIRQGTLPEGLWLAELKREAAPLLGGKTCRQWLKALNHPSAHIRQEALRTCFALPPAARCLLTAEAYRNALSYTNNISTMSVVIGVAILIALPILITGVVWGEWGGFAAGSVLAALFVVASINQARSSRQQELAKELLDTTHDARLIPYLALRMLPVRNGGAARRAMFAGRNLRNALMRLMPLVQEEEAAEWTGVHWNSVLCYLKNPYADIELTRAIMVAVARVGNEEAYRSLRTMPLNLRLHEQVAKRNKRAAIEANQQLLTQAQQECLPVLEARLQAQQQAQTLLRPSASANAPARDILLRPADAHADTTPAEQLLRPQSRE